MFAVETAPADKILRDIRLNKIFTFFAMVMLSMSSVTLADSAASNGEQLLQRFLNDTDTMQAGFQQVLRTHKGEVLQETSGMFYLQRADGKAGKFRWDYVAPFEQVIVSDGERIWMHDVELKQVTVQKQSAGLPQTPMALLEKNFDLHASYEVTPLDQRDGIYRLKLRNRDSNTDFGEIVIGVSKTGLHFLQLHDQFEQVTDIVFSDIQTNLDLNTEVFRFTPPEGTDVFGG